tara:strand:- start:19 stop:1074 length:1056 start_codon:yes stop_codon:yes gene_type:complete
VRRILFYGELPPNVTHGVSISNFRILNVLRKKNSVEIIEDVSCFQGVFLKLYNFFVSLVKLLSTAVRKVDVLYLNCPTSLLGQVKVTLFVTFSKIIHPKVKVISHLHRGDSDVFLKKRVNFYIFKVNLFLFDRVLVLSTISQKQLITSFPYLESKFLVLRNTVDIGDVDTSLCLDKVEQAKRFFSLCNYIKTKRIGTLVTMCNSIDVHLDLNGTISDDGYYQNIKKLDRKGLCDFGSAISGFKKYNKLSEAKALLLASTNEGMPLVILESLALGTPVICFDIGYIKDYVGQDYPGLVTNVSDIDFLEKIKWLEGLSHEEYLSLRKESYDIFWSNFSPAIIDNKLCNIFLEL